MPVILHSFCNSCMVPCKKHQGSSKEDPAYLLQEVFQEKTCIAQDLQQRDH
uniref:Uncharacterized protein n=1 Tax=Anguilla anguilla TaxID=7936 RepID=A0A0E9PAF4_ANGAN